MQSSAMESWLRMVSVFYALVLLFALSATADGQESETSEYTLDDLVLRAGNTEDEKERYKILKKLEQDSFEAGYEQAQETVGDWYEPEYQGNEGYD